MEILQGLLDNLTALLAAHPLAGEWYMAFVRFLFPALAVLILYRAVRSLLRIPHTPENWGQLSLPNGTSLPLTHWENILGRSKTADIYLNYPSISRQHAALCRGEDENWTLYDLGSKGGTAVNGEKVASSVPVKLGDTITLGGVPLIFLPQTVAEREEQEAKRRAERPAAIWPSFLWLTVFQVLACLQLLVAAGTEATIAIPLAFLGLTVLMWLYYAALRATRCVGFEMETIAFFLSTLSLSITASSAQSSLFKQFLAILLGLALFLVLGLFLRDLSRVQKNRWLMAAAAIGLLGITLVIGNSKYGAVNWISIGGMSFQPSEIAKICYIFAGAATLERLFHKRNLTLFIVLTGVCIGLPGGEVQLLHHRSLRGIVPAGVSDLPERVRFRGPAAPHRRHVPLCLQRRLRYDVRVGAPSLSEGHRYPGERQLCHRPQAPAAPDPGGPPAGGADRGPLRHGKGGTP